MVKTARIILSIICISTVGAFLSQDVFQHTHIFNDSWPPHARFHAVMDVYISIGLALITLWLVWRRKRFTTHVAVLLLALVQSGFVIASLIVGIEGSAPPGTPTVLGTKPPVIFATIFLILTLLCWYLLRNESDAAKS